MCLLYLLPRIQPYLGVTPSTFFEGVHSMLHSMLQMRKAKLIIAWLWETHMFHIEKTCASQTPRMELVAAKLSVKTSTQLRRELHNTSKMDILLNDRLCWDMSRANLGKFKIFVANQLGGWRESKICSSPNLENFPS